MTSDGEGGIEGEKQYESMRVGSSQHASCEGEIRKTGMRANESHETPQFDVGHIRACVAGSEARIHGSFRSILFA